MSTSRAQSTASSSLALPSTVEPQDATDLKWKLKALAGQYRTRPLLFLKPSQCNTQNASRFAQLDINMYRSHSTASFFAVTRPVSMTSENLDKAQGVCCNHVPLARLQWRKSLMQSGVNSRGLATCCSGFSEGEEERTSCIWSEGTSLRRLRACGVESSMVKRPSAEDTRPLHRCRS